MKHKLLLPLAVAALMATACKKDDNHTELKQKVIDGYAEIVYATYQDSYNQALVLQDKVDGFVNNPTEPQFNSLKAFWAGTLRISYNQTETFRFYGGPIDDANGREGQINPWPVDEAYIDYVQGNPNAGIINNAVEHPVLSKEAIKNLHKLGGETHVTLGYHAIEFLLWGQDLDANLPGQRPFADYTSAGNAGRRRQYLKNITDILVEDLKYTTDAWAPSSAYHGTFTGQDVNQTIGMILTGMAKFCKGELVAKRIELAYTTQNQKDEISCFSDQTHMDLLAGFWGIENVYYGRYHQIGGGIMHVTGLDELIEQVNPGVNTELKAKLDETRDAILAIQAPFDQEILTTEGRARCLKAIQAGNTLADKIVEAGNAMGIQVVL